MITDEWTSSQCLTLTLKYKEIDDRARQDQAKLFLIFDFPHKILLKKKIDKTTS